LKRYKIVITNLKEGVLNLKCSKCGTENPADAKFCENCGGKMGKGNRNLMILGLAVILIIAIAAVGLSGFIKTNTTALTLANNTTNNSNANVNTNNGDNSVNAQRVVCTSCGGTGKLTCNVCHGTGKDPNDPTKPCPGGQFGCYNGYYPCPKCQGDGFIDAGEGGEPH
jgi:hypothetical protein